MSLTNKPVWKQTMCHNCASLCSLREWRELGKTTYMSLFPMNYRNQNQHAADYIFGSNRQFSFGLWQLRRWNFDSEQFWLHSGSYFVLTWFMREAVLNNDGCVYVSLVLPLTKSRTSIQKLVCWSKWLNYE